ncbi:MAG TPA: hypothetical protein QF564_17155 [Pirellulaceae bacterium]|nr:hypothetical protein [Pirellulaceae bacterium]
MAIEFYCPGCGKLMRTPDPTAGRKGRCPHCATKVQIPKTSITPNADTPSASNHAAPTPQQPASKQPLATPPSGQPANNDPIQFVCASCQKTLRVPAANTGKKGKCPHCSAVMTIPTRSPVASQPSGAKWKGAPRSAASTSPIQFACPGCRKSVRVNASAAGQQGQCPHCKTVVKIPLTTTVSARPTTTPGLTPLDSAGGLTPLDGTTGLTPLDGTGGLTPLGSAPDPFASAANPFGGLTEQSAPGGFASQDPFGGAASFQTGPANPYTSPVSTPSHATRSGRSRKKGSDDLGIRMLIPIGRSVHAIIAGYLGLLSLGCCALGPFAVLFGILAVVDIQKNPEKGGIVRAVLGIVLGAIASLGLVLALVSLAGSDL